MDDITNRIVRVDVPGREKRVPYAALATGACIAPVEMSSRSVEPAAPATDGAAVVAEFSTLVRRGTTSTAIPDAAVLNLRHAVIAFGLARPFIQETLMSGEIDTMDIDGEFMARHDNLVTFLETQRRIVGQASGKAPSARVLATREGHRLAVKTANLLEPLCGSSDSTICCSRPSNTGSRRVRAAEPGRGARHRCRTTCEAPTQFPVCSPATSESSQSREQIMDHARSAGPDCVRPGRGSANADLFPVPTC